MKKILFIGGLVTAIFAYYATRWRDRMSGVDDDVSFDEVIKIEYPKGARKVA